MSETTQAVPAPQKAKRNSKKVPKTERNGSADSLRVPQVRILKVLARSSKMLSKSDICERLAKEFPTAAKYQGWMSLALGSTDPKAAKAIEKRVGYKSLISLKYVDVVGRDLLDGGNPEYKITPAGKKALAQAQA